MGALEPAVGRRSRAAHAPRAVARPSASRASRTASIASTTGWQPSQTTLDKLNSDLEAIRAALPAEDPTISRDQERLTVPHER